MTRDRSPCDGCRRVMDAALLDAVMVQTTPWPASIVCSEEAYCMRCHPLYVTVAGDSWRPLGPFTWRMRIAAAFWRLVRS